METAGIDYDTVANIIFIIFSVLFYFLFYTFLQFTNLINFW